MNTSITKVSIKEVIMRGSIWRRRYWIRLSGLTAKAKYPAVLIWASVLLLVERTEYMMKYIQRNIYWVFGSNDPS